jgi:hypothetical protein
MKRALDFIDSVKVHPSQIASRDALHDTLLTAIEQAQKQEPVAVPPDYVPLSDDRMRVFIDGVGEVPLAWPSTPPAAQQEPTDLELYQCWIDKPDGTIDGIASMRLALKKYGGRPAQPTPAQPTTATPPAAMLGVRRHGRRIPSEVHRCDLRNEGAVMKAIWHWVGSPTYWKLAAAFTAIFLVVSVLGKTGDWMFSASVALGFYLLWQFSSRAMLAAQKTKENA